MANINRRCPICNKIYSNKFLFWRNIFRCKQCGELIINRAWRGNGGVFWLIALIFLIVGNLIVIFSNDLVSFMKYIFSLLCVVFSLGGFIYQVCKVYREPQLERLKANSSIMTRRDLIIILLATIIIIGIVTGIVYLLK
jgi:magnesium-transporting ATPase (P-type)